MTDPKLYFNILTFEFPSENQTFYFSKDDIGKSHKIHKTLLPKEIKLKDIKVIDQVYQFSRMYWKSVRQQNLPVTIKYPEMVAQIAPHFDGDDIPEFGKDNLWFL